MAYLNAGTFGPLAQETVDAMVAQENLELEQGRSGKPYFDNLVGTRGRVRELFAGLLGTTLGQVAVTASTTTGCQIVLSGLRLEAGDEIVTTDEEHFGLLGPLHVSGARVRVAATRGRTGEEALEAVLGEVGPRTRLVALSHVSWMTGHILPLDEIKAQTNVPLLVDGAQSVGAIPVELGDVDFYTVSGQKWLCGPDATGALYVRDVDALDCRAAHVLVTRGARAGRGVRAGGKRTALRHGADPCAVTRRARGRAAGRAAVTL